MTEQRLNPWKTGLAIHRKLSYPARYGCYHELVFPGQIYHLDLNCFPKFIQGTDSHWPHPQEWVKVTGNGDPVYYSTQGYQDIFDLTGEYYYPHPSYPTNAVYRLSSLQRHGVEAVLSQHNQCCQMAGALARRTQDRDRAEILRRFSCWSRQNITARGRNLHNIIKARIPVLPPDCRLVDYDVLPVIVSEGCLANCGFCTIKTGNEYRVRSEGEILEQVLGLQTLLREELANYCGVFLGQHDGLAVGSDRIRQTIETVTTHLRPGTGHVRQPVVFLFGSTSSFLGLSEADLDLLGSLEYQIFMNIGLESFDQQTIEMLKKPAAAADNLSAFFRALEINRTRSGIRVSCNLVFGNRTGKKHLETIYRVLGSPSSPQPESIIYISPLSGSFNRKNFLQTLRRIQETARMPVLPYLIQRL